jgi:hypothetical protein
LARWPCLIAKAQLLQLLALELDQPRRELRAVMQQAGDHLPIFLRLERLDLALTLNDQAQRHRLHAARALGAGQLAPQHRREREAEQIVQRAARQIGIDQILIQLARMLHRRGDGILGDGVEGNALDLLGQRGAFSAIRAHAS